MREVPKSNQIKASVCTRILLILFLLCKSLVSIKIHPDSISGQQDVITTKILYTYRSDLGEAYYVSGSYSSKIQEEEMERAGGGGGGRGYLWPSYIVRNQVGLAAKGHDQFYELDFVFVSLCRILTQPPSRGRPDVKIYVNRSKEINSTGMY